jgi:hypothetical protein
MPMYQLDNSLVNIGLYPYMSELCSGFTLETESGQRELKVVKILDGKTGYPMTIAPVGDPDVVNACADALCSSIGQEKGKRRKKNARRDLTGNIEGGGCL